MTKPDELNEATAAGAFWQEICAALRSGDEGIVAEATTELADRLYERLLKRARRTLDDQMAADAATDAFYYSIAQIRKGWDCWSDGFFSRNVDFKVLDQLKKLGREYRVFSGSPAPPGDEEDGTSWVDSVPDPKSPSPDERLLEEALRITLASLPVELQEVIHLRFFEDRGWEEIAELLNTPLTTAYGRNRRGLDRLRMQLA